MSGTNAGGRKVSALAELPQAIAPARDLWPDIVQRLEPRAPAAAVPARPRRLQWLAAAAMVGCVAVGVWIGRSSLPGLHGAAPPLTAQGGTAAVPGVTPALTNFDTPTALDAAYVTDPRYREQRAALLRSLESRIATLPPTTRDKVLSSLATIQHAKEDLEQALGKDPGNALLQELLVNTYQDEMRVLTDVHEASEPGRGT
jgi:hypothetical protein